MRYRYMQGICVMLSYSERCTQIFRISKPAVILGYSCISKPIITYGLLCTIVRLRSEYRQVVKTNLAQIYI